MSPLPSLAYGLDKANKDLKIMVFDLEEERLMLR